jgi:two-component system chemotaxis response regulator CheB
MQNKVAIKVLVVDDSSLMRSHICAALVEHDMVTDTAANGVECLEKIKRFKPDVITLDINMPVMDGIECLTKIMAKYPTPVVMISSLTQKNAGETLKALDLGAVDYIAKPSGSVSLTLNRTKYMLVSKVINASKVKVASKIQSGAVPSASEQNVKRAEPTHKYPANSITQTRATGKHNSDIKLVVIGVSTGGPGCLQEIIPKLPANYPYPIVIAQHMPARFTKVFAARLNKLSNMEVEELSSITNLEAGRAYVAQGDENIEVLMRDGHLAARPDTEKSHHIWRPSITKLVESTLKVLSAKQICFVQLTGMGNDGAEAMAKAHVSGATTIAESEQTCIVYGMPKELVKLNGASMVLPNYDIANALTSL